MGGRRSLKLQLQFLHLPCLQETEFCGRNVLFCPTSSDGRSPVPKVTTAVFTIALFTGTGILWKECVVFPHLCKRTFKGEYVLTPARFIRPINKWGASEDFPALKNVTDRVVTLRGFRTNQKKLSGRGKESALGFGSEGDEKNSYQC
ncbi:hypothetical protein TNCV_2305511 [Trichonephila clavipes]|nr:hypothetical protein TNCV_2305511 [Trichonephila clavipes]